MVPLIVTCLSKHRACVETVEGAMGALGNIAALDANRPAMGAITGAHVWG